MTAVGGDDAHVLDRPEAGGRAIRGGVLRGGGFVAGALLAAISAPLLVRSLGVVDFGRYTTVVSLLAIVGGLTEGGVAAVGTREYAVLEGPARDRLMRSLIGMRLALTLVGCAAAILFAIVAGYGTELVAGTMVASAALLVGVLQSTYAIPLHATLVVGRVVVAELARQALTVAIYGILVLAGAGLVSFLAAPIGPLLGLLAVTFVLVRGQTPYRPSFDLAHWRELLRDTLPVALATAAQTLYFRSVIIIMSLVATGTETGLFSTSYRVIEVLSGIPAVLVATTFPILARAARSDLDRLRYALGRVVEVALIGGVWSALALIVGAEWVLDVIGGDEADAAKTTLQLQAVTLVQAFLGSAVVFGLLSLRRHAALVWASGIALLVIVAATFALVPPLGEEGAAIATLLGETVLGILLVAALVRSGVGLPLPLAVLGKVALAAGAGGGLIALTGLDGVPGVVVFSAVYWALLAALRAIPGELVGALRRRR